jgi:Luciferase-like monooxygenase
VRRGRWRHGVRSANPVLRGEYGRRHTASSLIGQVFSFHQSSLFATCGFQPTEAGQSNPTASTRPTGHQQPHSAPGGPRQDRGDHRRDLRWTPRDHGSHYHLTGARWSPHPVQTPHPPILIGGVGEQKLLRVAAEHADIWSAPGRPYVTVADISRKNHVLDQHCAAIHRDPRQIMQTIRDEMLRDHGDGGQAEADMNAG